jgi:recombination protein RecA
VLWVRCEKAAGSRQAAASSKDKTFGNVDCALRAADLVLQAGGFGLVALDLGDVPAAAARRVPLTSWFRFRRAVEETPAALLLLTPEAVTGTCAALTLQLAATAPVATAELPHARLLGGFSVAVEVARSAFVRRPGAGMKAAFATDL